MESITKVSVPFNALRGICDAHLSEALVRATELSDGWYNTAYRLEFGTGGSVVIKIAPHDSMPRLRYEHGIMESEVLVMRRVSEAKAAPVPEILAWDTSRSLLDHEFFIMEWLDGQPLDKAKGQMSAAALGRARSQIGDALRGINAITGDNFGLFRSADRTTWREAFIALFEDLIADGLDAAVDLPWAEIRAFLGRCDASLDVVAEPRLVHWDLWDGNVFVDPSTGKVVGLIDFERALWGDPLMEMTWSNVLADRSSPDSQDQVAAYGADLLNGPEAEVRRRLYDLYLFVVMIVENPYRRYTDLTGVRWAERRFAETMQALALVKL